MEKHFVFMKKISKQSVLSQMITHSSRSTFRKYQNYQSLSIFTQTKTGDPFVFLHKSFYWKNVLFCIITQCIPLSSFLSHTWCSIIKCAVNSYRCKMSICTAPARRKGCCSNQLWEPTRWEGIQKFVDQILKQW